MLSSLLPENLKKRRWLVIVYVIALATALIGLGIYTIEEYGVALFVLTPLFVGISATLLFGYGRTISTKEADTISFASLFLLSVALLVFAFEGFICIAMATPLGIPATLLGSRLGRLINNRRTNTSISVVWLLLFLIPATAFVEKDIVPSVHPVTTTVVIDATPQEVWKNVIAFPKLPEPTELLFKAGISYPINATIKGSGVGAVRHCNFNTGSFVEPITAWETAHLLQFDVIEQPEPMKELSFWDIDAPHLHDYFVSKRGQFKLTPLENGQTVLEGTTWYYHDIKPDIYWRLWSNWIIHSIHKRVLEHIKVETEKQTKNQHLTIENNKQ